MTTLNIYRSFHNFNILTFVGFLSYLIFAFTIGQKSFSSYPFFFDKFRKSSVVINTFISSSTYCFSIFLIGSTLLTGSGVLSCANQVRVTISPAYFGCISNIASARCMFDFQGKPILRLNTKPFTIVTSETILI